MFEQRLAKYGGHFLPQVLVLVLQQSRHRLFLKPDLGLDGISGAAVVFVCGRGLGGSCELGVPHPKLHISHSRGQVFRFFGQRVDAWLRYFSLKSLGFGGTAFLVLGPILLVDGSSNIRVLLRSLVLRAAFAAARF